MGNAGTSAGISRSPEGESLPSDRAGCGRSAAQMRDRFQPHAAHVLRRCRQRLRGQRRGGTDQRAQTHADCPSIAPRPCERPRFRVHSDHPSCLFSRCPENRGEFRPAWKSCVPARVPRVRIPLSPLSNSRGRRDRSDGVSHDRTVSVCTSFAPPPSNGGTEDALAEALTIAARAERWDIVAQLARELEARRLASHGVANFKEARAQIRPRG
jgi:hypothetical protein